MRILLLCFLFCFGSNLTTAQRSSQRTTFWNGLTIGLTLAEFGPVIPVNSNRFNDQPGGLNHYLKNDMIGVSTNFLSLSCYHQNKFGFELILMQHDYLDKEASDFNAYQESIYANYYPKQRNYVSKGYELRGLGYRFGYKFHFKYLTLVPKFQFGIDNYEDHSFNHIWKEKGSNHFVAYSMDKENLRNNTFDYHLLLEAYTSVGGDYPGEIGFFVEYMMTPTNYNYTITEAPYGEIPNVTSVNIKQNNPAWVIALSFKIMLKAGKKYRIHFDTN
jgi:hypothetical protein